MIRILENQYQQLVGEITCTCSCTCPQPDRYFMGYMDGYFFSDAYYKPQSNQVL